MVFSEIVMFLMAPLLFAVASKAMKFLPVASNWIILLVIERFSSAQSAPLLLIN